MPMTETALCKRQRAGQHVAERVPGKTGEQMTAQPFGAVSATASAKMRIGAGSHSSRASANPAR